MPNHIPFDQEKADKQIQSGGLSAGTIKAKAKHYSYFEKYVTDEGLTMEALLDDTEQLQELLIQYYTTFRVIGDKLPTKSYIDNSKSHVKTTILEKTKGMIDISNAAVFPRFYKAWKAIEVELKAAGRGKIIATYFF